MKKILSVVFICIIITSCAAAKDTVPVQILAASVGEEIDGFENLAEASVDYLKYCMNSDLSLYSEYIVLYPFSGTEYNEVGIFKVKDESDIGRGTEEIDRYLKFKKDNWDTRYMGAEFNKIEKAKVTSFGKYIMYTILDEDETKEVNEKFIKALK